MKPICSSRGLVKTRQAILKTTSAGGGSGLVIVGWPIGGFFPGRRGNGGCCVVFDVRCRLAEYFYGAGFQPLVPALIAD